MKLGGKSAAFVLIFLALALVTYLGSQFPARLDFTADKIYTLSPDTRRLLAELEEPVTFRFFFSRSVDTGDVQIQFKNYATRVEEMLRQFVAAGDGRVRLEVIDPQPDTDEEIAANRVGIQRHQLSSGNVLYFGLSVTQGTTEKTIPYFDWRREPFLEYDIAKLVHSVQQIERPKLGLITSLPLQGSPFPMPGQQAHPDQMSVIEWSNTYEIVPVEETATELPDDLDVLAVIHPQNPSEQLQFAIDQFLLSGKPVFVAVDPSNYFLRVTRQGPNQMMMMQQPQVSSSNLPKLLVSYGITYDPTQVVGDPVGALSQRNDSAPGGNPFWLGLTKERFSDEVEPTADLNTMWLLEPGSISVATDRGYEVTPLIQTSDRAGTMQAMMLGFMQGADISKQFKPEGGRRTIAALIHGTFKTAFPLGPPKDSTADENNDTDENDDAAEDAADNAGDSAETAKADAAETDDAKSEKPEKTWLKESTAPSSLVVVADADWLLDYSSGQRIQQLNAFLPSNDNLAFSTNIIDYLGGSRALIGIRSKGTSHRPFDVIVKMQAEAQEKYQAAMNAVEERLSEIQQELNKLVQEQNSNQQLVATPEMAEAIARYREQEAQTRAERREIRRQLREGVERLQNIITVANVLLVPGGILIIGVVYSVFRQSRRKPA